MKAREIVMDLETEARVMATEDVRETSCVAPTTVESLASTTTRRTTAVRGQDQEAPDPTLAFPPVPTGLPGAALVPAV